MTLYQRLCFLALLVGLVTGCSMQPAVQAAQQTISVTILANGQETTVQTPAESSVQTALDAAGLELGPLDRVEPPLFTPLGPGVTIKLVRVREEFQTEQEVIPFESKTVYNEALSQATEMSMQEGRNGLREITYRRVYEDGVLVSDLPVKMVILEEPQDEIRMRGIQAPFTPAAIPGRLVYLQDGNIWVMEDSSANRRIAFASGDLDGQIFTLSDDGAWLLFTRSSQVEGEINRLWALDLNAPDEPPVDLQVPNVIHFADFMPGTNFKIIFSTVEPRAQAPGWQANNDLYALTFSHTGWTTKWAPVLEANTGGVYGWWGTNFAWSPDLSRLAYARPDSIGLVDMENGTLNPLIDVLPLQTRSDWAWVPGFTWAADNSGLYLTTHIAPPGAAEPEASPDFDLAAAPLNGGLSLSLVSQAGMFAYPLASPLQPQESGENSFQLAYLQAIFPNQSETSRYRVHLMDRDGSNQRVLFPADDRPGLEPQSGWGAWAPAPLPANGHPALGVLQDGKLFLVDTISSEATQLTGDGVIRLAWK